MIVNLVNLERKRYRNEKMSSVVCSNKDVMPIGIGNPDDCTVSPQQTVLITYL